MRQEQGRSRKATLSLDASMRSAEYGLVEEGLECVDGRMLIAWFCLRRGRAMMTGTVLADGSPSSSGAFVGHRDQG